MTNIRRKILDHLVRAIKGAPNGPDTQISHVNSIFVILRG